MLITHDRILVEKFVFFSFCQWNAFTNEMFDKNESRWSRIYFETLNFIERIYHEINKNKNLLIRQNLFDYKVTTNDFYFSTSSLITLILTKICRRLNKNKINKNEAQKININWTCILSNFHDIRDEIVESSKNQEKNDFRRNV